MLEILVIVKENYELVCCLYKTEMGEESCG